MSRYLVIEGRGQAGPEMGEGTRDTYILGAGDHSGSHVQDAQATQPREKRPASHPRNKLITTRPCEANGPESEQRDKADLQGARRT